MPEENMKLVALIVFLGIGIGLLWTMGASQSMLVISAFFFVLAIATYFRMMCGEIQWLNWCSEEYKTKIADILVLMGFLFALLSFAPLLYPTSGLVALPVIGVVFEQSAIHPTLLRAGFIVLGFLIALFWARQK